MCAPTTCPPPPTNSPNRGSTSRWSRPGTGSRPGSSRRTCATCSTTCASRSRTGPGWKRWRGAWPTISAGSPAVQPGGTTLLAWPPPATGPSPPARTRPSSVSCCAGWPTATSPSSATANTTWCRPGKAPACAPCRGPGSASSATPGRAGTCCASCPHRWRPGRRTPANGWSWPRRTPGPPSTAPTTWTTSRSRGWPGAEGVWGERFPPRSRGGLGGIVPPGKIPSPGSSGSSACIRTRHTPRPSPASR